MIRRAEFQRAEMVEDEGELAGVEVVDAELVDGFGSDVFGAGFADEREQSGGAEGLDGGSAVHCVSFWMAFSIALGGKCGYPPPP